MRIWTPEARKAQAEAIRRWQPWKDSTGPRTEAGKAKVAGNACKESPYERARRKLVTATLRRQSRYRRLVRDYTLVKDLIKKEKQTIIHAWLNFEGDAVVAALVDCLAWLYSTPRDEYGDAERDRDRLEMLALSPCGIRRVA